jgi:hypothetical protein
MRRAPGEVIFTAPRTGAVVRYSPSHGSSVKYRTTCIHGDGVNDRTLADAKWSARHSGDFCAECAAEGWE